MTGRLTSAHRESWWQNDQLSQRAKIARERSLTFWESRVAPNHSDEICASRYSRVSRATLPTFIFFIMFVRWVSTVIVGRGPQLSLVKCDNRTANRQPHANPLCLAGLKRFEYSVDKIVRQAATVVADANLHVLM